MRLSLALLMVLYWAPQCLIAQKVGMNAWDIRNSSIVNSVEGKSALSEHCDDWLKVGNYPSFFRFGDLDIHGDQITVEAMFIRTTPWNGSDLYQGDLVSKHDGPDDCNYLLRPGSAEITTEHGYYKTPEICPIQLNKTYHAAMVYDGRSLKFYRNGYLMSEKPATGNLVTNDWEAQVGLYFNVTVNTQFTGYINEVRVWNIARTQEEIRSSMDKTLPDPTQTFGLQAYFIFNELRNKQGNTNWNGALSGASKILDTNPACTFTVDSCGVKKCDVKTNLDFSFQQDLCEPKLFSFYTNLESQSNATWLINGKQGFGSSPGVFMLEKYGKDNLVRLVTERSGNCKDTIQKIVRFNIDSSNLINTTASAFCFGDSILINSRLDLLQYCWNLPAQQGNLTGKGGWLKPKKTVNIRLHGNLPVKNLINNGDFALGNNGFESELTHNPPNGTPGYIFQNSLEGIENANCNAGTTFSNKILVATLGGLQHKKVWQQTISLDQNTNYHFQLRYLPFTSNKNIKIQVQFNGLDIIQPIVTNEDQCLWKPQSFSWTSGDLTALNISIVLINDNNQVVRLALDDLFFGKTKVVFDEKLLSKNPSPAVYLPEDTILCLGSKMVIHATTDSAGYTLRWNEVDNNTNSSAEYREVSPKKDTLFKVVATNDYGCQSSDSMSIGVNPLPMITLPLELEICGGNTISPTFQYAGVEKVTWSPNEGLSLSQTLQPAFNPTRSTRYFAELISKEGCRATDSFLIKVNAAPTGVVTKDGDIDCQKTSAQLIASGGAKYQWSPTTGLNNNLLPNPIATPRESTIYTVKITNEADCSVEVPITVNVTSNGKKENFLPNVFTPNADGLNDCFGVNNWGISEDFVMEIYNRWGQRIFFTKNQAECWDGRFKQVLQPQGTYVYYIRAKSICGDTVRKGTVMLIR